jgi:opacity protein-like surface antigen
VIGMRATLFALAATAFLTSVAAPAGAEGPWYVSGGAGGYQRESQGGPTTVTNGIISAPGTQHESFDTGYVLSLGVGYKLPYNFRVEGEFAFANYQSDKVKPISAPFIGLDGRDFKRVSNVSHDRYLVTLNGYYDVPIPDLSIPVAPYVGLGLGAAVNDVPARTVFQSASGVRFTRTETSGDGGVVQVEAGLGIGVGGGVTLGPAYRFMHFFGAANRFGDENAHVAKLALRYGF